MVAILKMPKSLFEDCGIDRRIFPRRQVQALVEGRRTNPTLDALQRPHLSLHLRDLSMGGLSAVADQPLDAGEHLSVVFPPMNQRPGWDASGQVLRCEKSAIGYRIAVAFDPLPAAAA